MRLNRANAKESLVHHQGLHGYTLFLSPAQVVKEQVSFVSSRIRPAATNVQ